MCLPSFTTQSLYEWSTLLMSLILYSLFMSGLRDLASSPRSLWQHHFSATTPSQICSLPSGLFSLVLFPSEDSLLFSLWFSSTFFPSQSYAHSPSLRPLLMMERTYLIPWLLFFISRSALPGFRPAFPVVYRTFPVNEPLSS